MREFSRHKARSPNLKSKQKYLKTFSEKLVEFVKAEPYTKVKHTKVKLTVESVLFEMSSFVNADLASDSDSDDADFNPETEVNDVSEEEQSGDEENPGQKPKKGKKKREQGWTLSVLDSESKEEEKAIKKAFEKEKEDLKIEAEKQKTEDLWSGMH